MPTTNMSISKGDARDKALREQLRKLLDFGDAHVTFDDAIKNLPAKLRGVKPDRLPYSIWQLVEHLRLVQFDILDFCVNPDYEEPTFPDDYWPKPAADADAAEPPSSKAWTDSLAQLRRDRKALAALLDDRDLDLFAKIPHGSGQTYLREFILVADHTAYHLGEIVAIRRLLGAWPAS
jgi:DinB family protein